MLLSVGLHKEKRKTMISRRKKKRGGGTGSFGSRLKSNRLVSYYRKYY